MSISQVEQFEYVMHGHEWSEDRKSKYLMRCLHELLTKLVSSMAQLRVQVEWDGPAIVLRCPDGTVQLHSPAFRESIGAQFMTLKMDTYNFEGVCSPGEDRIDSHDVPQEALEALMSIWINHSISSYYTSLRDEV